MSRSENEWRAISSIMNDHSLAAFVIADLIGYNSRSIYKDEDIESIRHLIAILRDES